MTASQNSFNDIKLAILSDPCLKHFDHNRLIVLRSDFLLKGSGYVVCQPGTDTALTIAMDAYCSGLDFSFMTNDSAAVLHPAAFGARRCCGNEVRLHSHLGEEFSSDWALNKCRHMLFGQRFVWTTDCYAIKFILSYDGANPAILRLQMRLMCWDVDIIHWNDHYIADADVESATMATGLPLGLDKKFVLSINGIRLPWGRYSLPDSTCTFVCRIRICILIVMRYRIGWHSGLPSALFSWDLW